MGRLVINFTLIVELLLHVVVEKPYHLSYSMYNHVVMLWLCYNRFTGFEINVLFFPRY